MSNNMHALPQKYCLTDTDVDELIEVVEYANENVYKEGRIDNEIIQKNIKFLLRIINQRADKIKILYDENNTLKGECLHLIDRAYEAEKKRISANIKALEIEDSLLDECRENAKRKFSDE